MKILQLLLILCTNIVSFGQLTDDSFHQIVLDNNVPDSLLFSEKGMSKKEQKPN